MELRRFVAKGNVQKLGDRIYRVPISDETKDRHGTVIKSDGWMFDNFLRNPIISHQHDTFSSDPDAVVGKGLSVELDGGITYLTYELEPLGDNPRADKLAKKLDFGSIRAVSVGFNPLSWSKGDRSMGEDPETIYFRKQDLLEVSIVTIPSNPNATPDRSIEDSFEEFVRMIKEETPTEITSEENITLEAKPIRTLGHYKFRYAKLRTHTF
jgi:HK97 family phage prohead protease